MKSIFRISTLLFFLFSCYSCDKEDINPDNPPDNTTPSPCINCDTSKLNIIWQEPLQEDTFDYGVRDILYHNNRVFYGVNFTKSPNDPVYARDADSGEFLWEWTDYHPRVSQNQLNELHLVGESLATNSWHEIQVVDANTGKNKWTTSVKDNGEANNGFPRMTTYGNDIFHIHNDERNFHHENHIVRANVDFPKWDTLISFFKKDSLTVYTEPPTIWVAPNGDEILLISVSYSDFSQPIFVGYTNFIAFNISKNELHFKIEDYIKELHTAASNIAVLGNTAILKGSHNMICVDLVSGQIKWEQTVQAPENFGGIPLIFENKVIVNSNNRTYAYDLISGQKLWENNDLIMSDTNTEFNGKLYGTSCNGRITCINMKSGRTIFHEKSPNRFNYPGSGYCFQGLTIDKENGRLYASDGYFIQCIKLF